MCLGRGKPPEHQPLPESAENIWTLFVGFQKRSKAGQHAPRGCWLAVPLRARCHLSSLAGLSCLPLCSVGSVPGLPGGRAVSECAKMSCHAFAMAMLARAWKCEHESYYLTAAGGAAAAAAAALKACRCAGDAWCSVLCCSWRRGGRRRREGNRLKKK